MAPQRKWWALRRAVSIDEMWTSPGSIERWLRRMHLEANGASAESGSLATMGHSERLRLSSSVLRLSSTYHVKLLYFLDRNRCSLLRSPVLFPQPVTSNRLASLSLSNVAHSILKFFTPSQNLLPPVQLFLPFPTSSPLSLPRPSSPLSTAAQKPHHPFQTPPSHVLSRASSSTDLYRALSTNYRSSSRSSRVRKPCRQGQEKQATRSTQLNRH